MKLLKMLKDNMLGFILGVILFGGIGTVLATTILSSSVSYTNNNQTTVEEALDELYGMVNIICYNGTCGKLAFRYWNDNFGSIPHQSNEMSTTVYTTRALLEQSYGTSNYADNPEFVRSILIDGNVVGHQACLFYNNKEFCLSNGYWAGALGTKDTTVGTNTQIKLQGEMQNALSLESTGISCNSRDDVAYCNVGDFYCIVGYSGSVNCGSNITNKDCFIDGTGFAICD